MSLSIQTDLSTIAALNQLSITRSNLAKTLDQLSSGTRIRSGADDAAALSIADGLQVEILSLTQSCKNANDAIGFLQTADGALAQINDLLNRAITLATEAANETADDRQRLVADQEYQDILAEITRIGSITFNGLPVFTDGLSSPITLTENGDTITATIDPADSLSGSITFTATIPGVAGVTTDINLSDEGTRAETTITPGATLTGEFAIASTVPGSAGVSSPVAVTNNPDGTVSLGPVAGEETLSGSVTFTGTVPAATAAPTSLGLAGSGSTISGTVISGNTLSGGFTVTATVPDSGGVPSPVNLSNNGTTITGTVSSGSTITGDVTITSTVPASGGVSSAINLTDNSTTITGTVDPADTLSGSFTVTSTIPAGGGVESWVGFANTGTTIEGVIDPGSTLGGYFVINKSIPSQTGAPEALTFTASGSGSSEAITSSAITTGYVLAGSLVVDSTYVDGAGEIASTSASLDLANYQGLSSSDSGTATAAANQLADDLTSSLGASTGSTYTATITSGVLEIKTSQPWDVQTSSFGIVGIENGIASSVVLSDGAELSGTLHFWLTPNNSDVSVDMSNYQGLTSADSATRAAALTSLSADLTAQASGGATFTASLDADRKLQITSNRSGTYWIYSQPWITVSSGDQMSVGSGTDATQASFTPWSDSPTTVDLSGVTTANLASYLSSRLGTDFTVDYDSMSGALTIGISGSGAAAGYDAIAVDTNFVTQTTPVTPQVDTSTVVNLSGLASSTLQSTLESALGSNYTVSYDTDTGALSIGISAAGVSAGIASIASSENTAQQTTPVVPQAETATPIEFVNVSTTVLQDSLQFVLGSNYTVSYDPADGALSIGISTSGAAAGITSISSSANSIEETAPFVSGSETPTSISLDGVSTADLQSYLQSRLGSNYTVSYDSGSGALTIEISAAGTAAGITTIDVSDDTAQQIGSDTPETYVVRTLDFNGQTGDTLGSFLSNNLPSEDFSVALDSETGGWTVSAAPLSEETGSGVTSVAASDSTLQATTPAVAPVTSTTSIDLSGVATADLQNYLGNQLGGDYTVTYDQETGDLSIALNPGNPDGFTSFSSSSTVQQNVGGESAVTTSTTVHLDGITAENLQSELQSALGDDYTVSYDTDSGALSIGISTAGATAGITSIDSSANTARQTSSEEERAGMQLFIGNGGSSDGQRIDFSVGVLNASLLGLSATQLTNRADSLTALARIANAISVASGQRGEVGAKINRLQAATDVMMAQTRYLIGARSEIMDADVSETLSSLTRYGILESVTEAVLAQASRLRTQGILTLLWQTQQIGDTPAMES